MIPFAEYFGGAVATSREEQAGACCRNAFHIARMSRNNSTERERCNATSAHDISECHWNSNNCSLDHASVTAMTAGWLRHLKAAEADSNHSLDQTSG